MIEAYKVGVTLALTNKVSAALGLISRDFTKTDLEAKKLKATLKEIKLLGIGGAIIGGAGFMGLKALDKGLEAAREYQRAFAQFKAINLGAAVNKDADKFARGTEVIGSSAVDLMETLRDLHTALGDYDMAKQLAPHMARMKFSTQAVFGASGMNFDHRQMQAMGKIIEMKGGFHSPADFLLQANMMQKVVSGTGGMVQPTDYLQFIKTAGLSGRLLDNEAFYYVMEPLIQEMTGGRVGTGVMTSYNNLAQGRSTVRAANQMMKLGLLDPKMVEWTKIGTVKQIKPGALLGMDQFTSNPYEWMKEVFLPQLAKLGITDEKEILNIIGSIWGHRMGSNLFSLMFLQQEKIDKNIAISKGAMDTDELYKLAQTTPDGVELALGGAWKNLKIAMGEALWPVIIPWINSFADTLRSLGRWINQNQEAFDFLVKSFAAISALTFVGGGLMLLTASLEALGLFFGVATGFNLSGAATGMKLFAGALGPLVMIALAIANSEAMGELVSGTWAEKYNPFLAVQRGAAAATERAIHGGASAPYWMSKDADSMSSEPSSAIDAPPSGKFQFKTTVNIDGRTVAHAVNTHNLKDAARSSGSGSQPDYRALPVHPGAAGR